MLRKAVGSGSGIRARFLGLEGSNGNLLERKLGEEFGQREAEAGEHVFAFEGVGHAQEAVGLWSAVNENRFLSRIENPDQAGSAGKIVRQFFLKPRRTIPRRKHFNDQIGSTTEVFFLLCRRHGQARFRDEGNIGREEIARIHPATQTGTADDAEAMLGRVREHGGKERGDDAFVAVTSRAHDDFSFDEFTFVAVLGQSHQLFLGPGGRGGFHGETKRARNAW